METKRHVNKLNEKKAVIAFLSIQWIELYRINYPNWTDIQNECVTFEWTVEYAVL